MQKHGLSPSGLAAGRRSHIPTNKNSKLDYTSEVLADYAANYRLDSSKWSLLTGDRRTVSSLMERLEITTVKTPTRFTESGAHIYFIDHTDRVSLIDKDGNLRRNYTGSKLRSEEVVEDIRTILGN